jgi:chromate transporter
MTAGIFLPAFCFTLLGHGLFERITANRRVHDLLDGVTAAVVGIMAATTISLLQAGITDWRQAGIVAAGVAVLWYWSGLAAVPAVVLLGGLAGLALGQG